MGICEVEKSYLGGASFAIAFTLYKPLHEKNTQVINEVVSVQGWLYRRVAYIVIAGALGGKSMGTRFKTNA